MSTLRFWTGDYVEVSAAAADATAAASAPTVKVTVSATAGEAMAAASGPTGSGTVTCTPGESTATGNATLAVTVVATAGDATAGAGDPTVTAEAPGVPIGLSTIGGPPPRRVEIHAPPGEAFAGWTYPDIEITPEDEDLIFAAAGVLELV